MKKKQRLYQLSDAARRIRRRLNLPITEEELLTFVKELKIINDRGFLQDDWAYKEMFIVKLLDINSSESEKRVEIRALNMTLKGLRFLENKLRQMQKILKKQGGVM